MKRAFYILFLLIPMFFGSCKKEVIEPAAPYKVYNAKLTQVGTDDPIVTVFGSNEIGAIVWTRTGAGQYKGTLAGAFDVNKTQAFIGAVSAMNGKATVGNVGAQINWVTITTTISEEPTDVVLDNTSIEIRVYN